MFLLKNKRTRKYLNVEFIQLVIMRLNGYLKKKPNSVLILI